MGMGEMGHELTLRMTAVVERLKDKYAKLYNTEDFSVKIDFLNRCSRDEIGSVQAELIHMFNKCGVKNVKSGQPSSYYADILNDSSIPSPKEMTHNVYNAFLQEFKENPYPLPEEYISRIVDSKIFPTWGEDSLRLKILKVFIRDAASLKEAGYQSLYIKQYVRKKTGKKKISSQDLLENLDDLIFEVLANADHQQCRKNGKYGLLKIADDLSSGKFGNCNVVREEIFLFAIVFELMYFTGNAEEKVTDEERSRDIEKVMFSDYYTNNIMRFVSSSHEYLKRGGELQNPTGKGINYKNYMEVIFLYYLRRWDLTVEEKIIGVYRMAKDVHCEYMNRIEEREDSSKNYINRTCLYTESFKNKVLETEEEFKEFLVLNYDCSIRPENTPVFSLETEQNTAMEEYEQLLIDAKEYGVTEDNCEKWTLAFLADEVDVDNVKKVEKARISDKAEFDGIDDKTKFDILIYEVNRDICKKKSRNELEKKVISRTDILRLFYQIYISMNDSYEDETMRSFPDVYEDFSELANQHLENALLRPINGRDLYDLILIYSAYCNINEDKFE